MQNGRKRKRRKQVCRRFLARLAIPLFLPRKGNRQIFPLKNTEKLCYKQASELTPARPFRVDFPTAACRLLQHSPPLLSARLSLLGCSQDPGSDAATAELSPLPVAVSALPWASQRNARYTVCL